MASTQNGAVSREVCETVDYSIVLCDLARFGSKEWNLIVPQVRQSGRGAAHTYQTNPKEARDFKKSEI